MFKIGDKIYIKKISDATVKHSDSSSILEKRRIHKDKTPIYIRAIEDGYKRYYTQLNPMPETSPAVGYVAFEDACSILAKPVIIIKGDKDGFNKNTTL